MYCAKCNSENEQAAKFCWSCGSKLAGAAEPAGKLPEAKSSHGGQGAVRGTGRQAPKLSKGFFLGSIGAGLGVAYLLSAITFIVGFTDPDTALMISGISVLFALFAIVVEMVLVYRAWESIQDGHARATPGKAVGFLFIPFFNLYWLFQAFWGFSQDFNRLVRRRGLNISLLPEGLFLAYPIFLLTTWIPVVGLLTGAAAYVLLLVMVAMICDRVNALGELAAEVEGSVTIPQRKAPADPAYPEGAPPQGRPFLKGVAGHFAGAMVELEGAITIGRDPALAQLVYPQSSDGISRKHCSIHFDRPTGKFVLEDFSSNGTFLSSFDKITPHKPYYLNPGARFFLAGSGEAFEVTLE